MNESEYDDLPARVRRLEFRDALDLGPVPAAILAYWPDAASDRVVIIGERYRHILERHSELSGREHLIIRAALDPDSIHVNRNDLRMAILYWSDPDGSRLRISLGY